MAEYTDEFRRFLNSLPARQVGTHEEWINEVVKPMGVFEESRMYKPLIVPVRTTTNRKGNFTAIRIQPARKDWYPLVQKNVAAMMGMRDYRHVDLRTIFGRSIKDMDTDELANVDELQVYDGERQVLAANAPIPPTAIHPCRDDMLDDAWYKISDEIGNLVGDVLQGSDTDHELSSRLVVEDASKKRAPGAMEKALRKHVASVVDHDFIEDFAENEWAAGADRSKVVNLISRMIMEGVRESVRASQPDINKCMSAHQSQESIFNSSSTVDTPYSVHTDDVDEWATYKKIGDYAAEHVGNHGNFSVMLMHGHPWRPHHHPRGHSHHKVVRRRTVVDQYAVRHRPNGPMTPYGRPTRDFVIWHLNKMRPNRGVYGQYCGRGGAFHSKTSAVVMKKKGNAPPAREDGLLREYSGQPPPYRESASQGASATNPQWRNPDPRAMDTDPFSYGLRPPARTNAPYRGSYMDAAKEYHHYAGRAPAPTPSMLRSMQTPGEAAFQLGEMASSYNDEAVPVEGWISDQGNAIKLRVALARYKAAQKKDSQERMDKWGKVAVKAYNKLGSRVQGKFESKMEKLGLPSDGVSDYESSSDSGGDDDTDSMDAEALMQMAVNEVISDGESPVAIKAKHAWYIGCETCDSAKRRRITDKDPKRAGYGRSEFYEEDMTQDQPNRRDPEYWLRQESAAYAGLADSEAGRKVAEGLRAEAAAKLRGLTDASYANAVMGVHAAIVGDAKSVIAAHEPRMIRGHGAKSVPENIANTMFKYITKYAALESPDAALALAKQIQLTAPAAAISQSIMDSVVEQAEERWVGPASDPVEAIGAPRTAYTRGYDYDPFSTVPEDLGKRIAFLETQARDASRFGNDKLAETIMREHDDLVRKAHRENREPYDIYAGMEESAAAPVDAQAAAPRLVSRKTLAKGKKAAPDASMLKGDAATFVPRSTPTETISSRVGPREIKLVPRSTPANDTAKLVPRSKASLKFNSYTPPTSDEEIADPIRLVKRGEQAPIGMPSLSAEPASIDATPNKLVKRVPKQAVVGLSGRLSAQKKKKSDPRLVSRKPAAPVAARLVSRKPAAKKKTPPRYDLEEPLSFADAMKQVVAESQKK